MRSKAAASPTDQMLAIARRDFAVRRSYQFQFVMQFFGIVFSLATFFFISRLVGQAEELGPYQGQYFLFALVGILLMSSTVVGLQTFSGTINSEQNGGTLEILLSTPTRLASLLAGSFIVPMGFVGIEISIFLVLATTVFGARFPLAGLLMAIPVLALTVLTFCAFGIVSAAFVILTKRGDPISPLLANGSSLLAGALFPVTLLPAPLEALSRLIPAYYGLTALRAVLIDGAGAGDVMGEIAALIGFAIILLPLSLWLFARALRIARVIGTLGNY